MSFLEQLKKIIIYRKGFYNLMIHDENLSKYKRFDNSCYSLYLIQQSFSLIRLSRKNISPFCWSVTRTISDNFSFTLDNWELIVYRLLVMLVMCFQGPSYVVRFLFAYVRKKITHYRQMIFQISGDGRENFYSSNKF